VRTRPISILTAALAPKPKSLRKEKFDDNDDLIVRIANGSKRH